MPEPAARARQARPTTDSPGRVVAHRGASRIAPENTLAAFRLAATQGARWVEFDVSLLGDATPVLHHDATLDRCTDRSGPLDRLRAADLGGIDSGSWFGPAYAGEPVATLDAALDLFAALGLSANLEMKPHGADPEPMARRQPIEHYRARAGDTAPQRNDLDRLFDTIIADQRKVATG